MFSPSINFYRFFFGNKKKYRNFAPIKYNRGMDIKGVVKAHGTTLNSVAEKMGISKGRLSQIINGKPTVENLRTIAEKVGCKVGDFFKDEMTEEKDSSSVLRCPHCGKEIRVKLE